MSSIFLKRTQCPVCESNRLRFVFSIPYSHPFMLRYLSDSYVIDSKLFAKQSGAVNYEIVKCSDCSTLFQSYEPEKGFLNVIYDEYIDPKKSLDRKQIYSKSILWLYSSEMSLISTLLNKSPAESAILDYACGWGVWSRVAVGWGFKVTALDLSEHRSEHLVKSGIKVINSINLRNENFDFVNCDQIFEHLCAPLEALIEINKVLQPNGVVKISVPHSFYPWLEVGKLMKFGSGHGSPPDILAPLEHLNYLNRKSLKILANRAGFDVLSVPLTTYLSNSHYFGGPLKEVLKNFIRPFYRYFFANFIFLKKR